MKHLLLTLIGIITLAGCAKPSPDRDMSLSYEIRPVAVGSACVGRFFFIHGMGQHISDLKAGEWARMGDHMHDAGFEVVYIGWPFLLRADMSNKGEDYVKRFQGWISDLNAKLPAVPLTYIGGSSMGGWHSIIASEVIHADAVYAIEPVVYLPILWPFADADTSSANLSAHRLPTNLFVTVGLSDTSVGFWLERSVLSAVPEYHEYQGENHAPWADQFNDAMSWLDTQTQNLSQNEGVRCAPYGTPLDEMNCHYRRSTKLV